MARKGYGYGYGYGSRWPTRSSVADRRADATRELARLRKKGRVLMPIAIAGTKIATTFWGRAWCTNLESYSDYSNRLPRGRSYLRNGSVLHLEINEGNITAIVHGTDTYEITIAIKPLAKPRWRTLVDGCSGQVTSLIELLKGSIPQSVMEAVSSRKGGLFPDPKEISLACSCPDWATMCKHVAAVMYGVGARLDEQPDLLFRLRGVDHADLVSTAATLRVATRPRKAGRTIDPAALGHVFGIEIDTEAYAAKSAPGPATPAPVAPVPRGNTTAKRKRTTRPNPRSSITLADLAATGLTVGEVADLLANGTITATPEEGVYRTTSKARATLLRRR